MSNATKHAYTRKSGLPEERLIVKIKAQENAIFLLMLS
jgi:hypothetical protein